MEGIASGKTLTALLKEDGMPPRTTFYRWLTIYPELNKTYEAARELSAQSFEEEALDMARTLKGPNEFSGTKVKMYEVAMAQLRWSAARRDPKRYGQRQEASLIVPIQINTTMDIGGNGSAGLTLDNPSGSGSASPDSVYHIEAILGDPIEDTDTLIKSMMDVPDEQYPVIPPKKKPGPKPGSYIHPKHKTPGQTRATIGRNNTWKAKKDVRTDTDTSGTKPVSSGDK